MSLPSCLPGIVKQENKELAVFQGAFQAGLVLPLTSNTSRAYDGPHQPTGAQARSNHPNMSLLHRQGQPSTQISPLQMHPLIIHGPELMW